MDGWGKMVRQGSLPIRLTSCLTLMAFELRTSLIASKMRMMSMPFYSPDGKLRQKASTNGVA